MFFVRTEELELTKDQKANLKKLADYLMTLPEQSKQFSMNVFFVHEGVEVEEANEFLRLREQNCHTCGTVACAVGHGPMAGVEIRKSDGNWYRYSIRAFGIHNEPWDWCFNTEWYFVDNTPQGAAKRILYMLEHGVPYNWKEQMRCRNKYQFAK